MLFLTTLLLSLLSLVAAQSSNSSVFVYDGEDGTSVVFALQADKATGDLYFHMSAPAGNGWVGVGIGYHMAGSLMLIAYADGDNSVTVSPRYATDQTEPVYQSDITVEQMGVNSLTTTDNIQNIVANGVCRACVTWNDGGSIDLTSTAQAFIFAAGPPFPPLLSSSKSAGLTMHSFVGHFTMNMVDATVESGGAVPTGPFDTRQGATSATNTETTNNPGAHIHGLVMAFVFIILLPLGTLALRVWNSVRYHAVVQCVALVLFCMAFAGGIVASMLYNRSKHYNSAHQIIGMLLLVALLTQLAMGIMHHRVYKKEQRKTIRGWIHLYLGPAIIFFGLINGILGFVLAQEAFIAIPYCIIVIIVGIIYSCVRFFSWRRKKRNAAFKDQQRPAGYPTPQYGQQPPPPNYAEFDHQHPQVYRSQDVPLERYHSNPSVPQLGMPAQEPRTML